MGPVKFIHQQNVSDHTFNLICLCCGCKVATSLLVEQLPEMETSHDCAAFRERMSNASVVKEWRARRTAAS
jgi:cellobiose-specific phosphotransferase system component IIB